MDPINKQTLYNMVDKLSIEFFDKPFEHEVKFNHRLRTTGGRYIPAKKLIELNPKYVSEMDLEEFVGIIKHELCHYHLHIEGKGYKHIDPEFKALLKKTGSPRHCNPLPSQKRKYQYVYKCKQCNQEYKRIRRVDLNKYRCGKCSGMLMQLKL
ncbi:SprT family protein [Oceanobacillus sp. 143]|uniref:Protein SprT-like n=1 Tax=Oceanobacillus zhaokaii TaxID=2052660 RepID=A0A345PDG9_9BACI|nr:SprT family protein [Oceanobacillus zhaokaii]AXI08049.1 SprT family protein [Oceanobacillus zhaokaii]QGS68045.1 SprT family protein [Oceanobacillus sp. 143]